MTTAAHSDHVPLQETTPWCPSHGVEPPPSSSMIPQQPPCPPLAMLPCWWAVSISSLDSPPPLPGLTHLASASALASPLLLPSFTSLSTLPLSRPRRGELVSPEDQVPDQLTRREDLCLESSPDTSPLRRDSCPS